MRRLIVLSSVIWLAVFAGSAQAADVRINVNIGAPPPIIVRSAPTMVFLPEPALYVAVGIPYDLYFVGGRYYHYRGNNWYWGHGYGGPWTPVVYTSLPYGLRKFKPARLHEFREREYRVYRVSGRDRGSRYFVADYGPSGKGRGNGRANGHKKH
ncbi:MAG TPA: hypothetical protein VFE29_05045 [Terriglobia bacterium]|nr:hypothetical protein [Terriglobia bacterium]